MKKLFYTSLFLILVSTCQAQYAPYRNGYNAPGSYYSHGSTNYPSGIHVNGYSYSRAYIPDYPYLGYIPTYPTPYIGRGTGFVPQQSYWWHDRLYIKR